jgi:ABC-type antimicrobial peptide transport system permease subunit
VAPRTTKKLMSRGNRGYGLSYALSAIRANPSRAITLALTLSLGISLFAAPLVWGDTGVYVSIYEYLGDNAYQAQVTPGSTVPAALRHQALAGAEQHLLQSPYVDSVYRLNSTIGLVNGTELPDSTVYDFTGAVYSSGMKDCQVVFVDNEFLNTTRNEFSVQGNFQLHEGEIIVSLAWLYYVYIVFDVQLQLGDTVNIDLLMGDVARSGGDPIATQIGDLDRLPLTSLTIVGIFDPLTLDSIIERAMPSIPRATYAQTNMRYQVLGIRDSVLILKDSVPVNALSPDGFFEPTTLVRASAAGLTSGGPTSVADHLVSVFVGTADSFDVNWVGVDQVYELQGAVNTYLSTTELSILALPVILLALFFSVFAADTFMAPRRLEIGVIRSKGASYSQVSSIFLWESAIIALISIGLGVLFSVLFAPLIASSTNFMAFDWNVYLFYLTNTVLTPSTIVRAVGLTVLPSLLFILYQARRASQTEIGLTLMEVTEDMTEQPEAHGFTIGASVTLLALALLILYILPRHPLVFMLGLGLSTAAWFFIAFNGSRITRVALAKVSARLSFLLGQKNYISAGYLRMRKGRIIPLMVVLVLTISSTIAFAVQSESLRVDLNREVSYAIGSDLRVECTPRGFGFNGTLESYAGVVDSTPILDAWGRYGIDDISIQALNATAYALIGNFDQSSFPGRDSSEILAALDAVSNGIIISSYHSQRWNKTVGDTIRFEMSGVGSTQMVEFLVVGIVHSAPGLGFASTTDMPPSPLGSGFGFQADPVGFAIANIGFVANRISEDRTDLFLAGLSDSANRTLVTEELQSLAGVYPFFPATFNLRTYSLQTALFLNTVEGLFSLGFAMSLVLSIFALTISLGAVVRERRKEYAVMRAVGGSKRQVVSMVFSEFTGVVLASLVLSIILGALFGFAMGLLVNIMSPFSRVLGATISFPFLFLTIVLAIEIGTMIIGAYLPAREAANTEPAVVLRNL